MIHFLLKHLGYKIDLKIESITTKETESII